ncbi:MAG: hypothetical protein B6247_23875 [Candidatus Parabeggiatoa sp. nov. 2]|nr:MAG: hypothetical protein B6247_23875 [Beggiatoa sp. 4572_84]
MIDYANQIVPRCLTPKQRQQFFLPPDPSHDLIEEGIALAKAIQIEAAIAKFQAAKKLAPCHKFDPEKKVKQILLPENRPKLAKLKFVYPRNSLYLS